MTDESTVPANYAATLFDLSGRIGAQVVAEGIEAEAELATLRDMGVPLGQGRFLAAPVEVAAASTVAP